MVTRIYLGVVAIILLASVAYLFNPDLFSMNGQDLGTTAAHTDIRAMYGAFPIGLGLFLLPGLRKDGPHALLLLFCALMFGGVIAGRLIGIALDGGDQSFNMGALLLEVPLFLAGLALYLRERRRGTPA